MSCAVKKRLKIINIRELVIIMDGRLITVPESHPFGEKDFRLSLGSFTRLPALAGITGSAVLREE